MKKIISVVLLGLILQVIPARVLASGPPPPPPTNSATIFVPIAAAFLAADLLGLFSGGAKDSAKNEFEILNNNEKYSDLLNQSAGGELNTLEILK